MTRIGTTLANSATMSKRRFADELVEAAGTEVADLVLEFGHAPGAEDAAT